MDYVIKRDKKYSKDHIIVKNITRKTATALIKAHVYCFYEKTSIKEYDLTNIFTSSFQKADNGHFVRNPDTREFLRIIQNNYHGKQKTRDWSAASYSDIEKKRGNFVGL